MMGMIYGFDNDSDDSVQEFIDFVNASNAPIVMAGLLNALPCTPLITRMQKQGRMIQTSSGNNSDGIINFIPYNFSVQQAEQNYLRILQGIYQPQVYFARVMRHLELIDPELQSNYRAGNNSLTYLVKILTKNMHLRIGGIYPQRWPVLKDVAVLIPLDIWRSWLSSSPFAHNIRILVAR